MIALTAATTLATGLFLAPAPTASAAATSCYGSAKTINGTDDNGHWPPGGSTKTTSNCNDINVKITRTIDVQTCFAPTSGGYYCNGWRTVYANTWGLAATDVKDGTTFWLLFTSTDVHGLAAY
ncbi:hypothetical protein AB0I54_39570 [Streptomyces sp. NPDC050625]|uniref:hypothetical protein n=1 Tax=Streptomyces sp. NPDC050625 TaxID=3154629 RepID=UPI00343BA088